MDIEEYHVWLLTPVENRLQQERCYHKRTSQKLYDQVCEKKLTLKMNIFLHRIDFET